MKRRVVVTGLGAVTPIGNTAKAFWAGVRAGKVGIGPITKFDTTDYKVKIAAEVKDFDPKSRLDAKAAGEWSFFLSMLWLRLWKLWKMPAFPWKRRIPTGWASSSAPAWGASRLWKQPVRKS